MSNKTRVRQYSDPKGAVLEGFDGNIIFASGVTVPTDTTPGYSPGCLFIDRDAAAGLQLYINEGTAASCDFNPYAGGATAAELGQAADTSAQDEVVITTNVIDASESPKTFYLALAAGFTSTLPAPAIGLKFRFIVQIAPTGAPYVITTASSANIMYGMMVERAGGAGVAGAARDTFNFIHTQSIIGDWVEFYSDGTNWYYHGMTDVSAGSTVAAT